MRVVEKQLELGARAGWLTNGPDMQSYEAFVAAYGKVGHRALDHME